MKTPAFWYRSHPSLLARWLAPLGWLQAAVVAARLRRHPVVSPIPVVCVGNATAGGSGKTPAAMALEALLSEMGAQAHFVSRGYKGHAAGSLRVDPVVHDARMVGDEPLLLSAQAPTWVGKSRVRSVLAAALAGARCVVMDDGLQNPFVAKSLSFCVLDGAVGIGNGLCLPAGPLREPLAAALARCHAVILIGEDETGVLAQVPQGMPVVRARLVPGPEVSELRQGQWLAFCGLGRPEKFFGFLRTQGVALAAVAPFADHHAYSGKEMAALHAEAVRLGAGLLTTAKDMARLSPELRVGLSVLSVRLVFENPDQVRTLLAKGCCVS
ncbi:MAG TPA: tetraacyldisaccharide 4'-kinase [Rhodospirillaceae bacterium]|nr:MAG: tetraacyldisaccharide 4'-kinase [Alphaproteobacteria bacterium GWF2_58_20]HAU28527.1 tetraacyldisaccharide 4'-kinase [Rhodospirillaceae bacterium]